MCESWCWTELLLWMQGALFIGGDNSFHQCVAAVDNVIFAQEMHAVHIINADVIGKLCVQHYAGFWVAFNKCE